VQGLTQTVQLAHGVGAQPAFGSCKGRGHEVDAKNMNVGGKLGCGQAAQDHQEHSVPG